MTKKEFKRAMLCGLGRCILELRETEDKEKYRDIVLWACGRNISYDAQCEGTKARYVYDMINCYDDTVPFLEVIIEKFQKIRNASNWNFGHYCELLGCFSDDGDERAYRALWAKYKEVFCALLHKRKRDSELICMYENLAITLSQHSRENAFRIMKAIGRMLQKDQLYEWDDFLWANHCIQDTFKKSELRQELKKASKTSLDIKYYLEGMENYNKKEKERDILRNQKSMETEKEEALQKMIVQDNRWIFGSMRLRRCLIKEGLESQIEIADQVLTQTDEIQKARLLSVFRDDQCIWPLDHSLLITYAESSNEKLSEAALDALCYIKHEEVRDFALQNIEKEELREAAVKILARNYQKNDEKLMMQALRKIPVDNHLHLSWHGVYSRVFDLYDKRFVKNPPKEILYFLYEHNMCGFCREFYVREMKRRHILTEDMVRECRWDSNCDIREIFS